MQKAYRIRKNGQFHYVFRKGKSMGTHLLSLVYVRAGKLQVGFAVNKKVGHAVVRFRQQIPSLKNGFYVFVARPEAADATYWQLEQAMRSLLKRHGLYRNA